ncbi:MAG: hypothetical protein ACYYKD_07750 [Rhodospirillales bacterium]
MAEAPKLPDSPTPEERAAFVIQRLEQFIRDGRSLDEGMSFKKWQVMAHEEITAAIADMEREIVREAPVTRRVLFVFGASVSTIGFWGASVSMHDVGHVLAAAVCITAGLALLGAAGEWKFRKFWARREANLRRRNLDKLENLNKRVKKLLSELEDEAKDLEKELEEVREAAGR